MEETPLVPEMTADPVDIAFIAATMLGHAPSDIAEMHAAATDAVLLIDACQIARDCRNHLVKEPKQEEQEDPKLSAWLAEVKPRYGSQRFPWTGKGFVSVIIGGRHADRERNLRQFLQSLKDKRTAADFKASQLSRWEYYDYTLKYGRWVVARDKEQRKAAAKRRWDPGTTRDISGKPTKKKLKKELGGG